MGKYWEWFAAGGGGVLVGIVGVILGHRVSMRGEKRSMTNSQFDQWEKLNDAITKRLEQLETRDKERETELNKLRESVHEAQMYCVLLVSTLRTHAPGVEIPPAPWEKGE